MVLFLLERARIGKGGAAGPPGLVEDIAAKAAQGMKVVLIQGKICFCLLVFHGFSLT